jgi:hypothetical protein
MIMNQAAIRRPLVWFGLLLAFGIAAAGASVLFFFNPAQYHFYPICLFHALTGLECPGCGGSRALYDVLHGQILSALRCNALVVLALPFIVFAGVRWLAREAAGRPHPPFKLRVTWIKLLIGVVVVFTILRNIPVAPFTFLAPP